MGLPNQRDVDLLVDEWLIAVHSYSVAENTN